ncbi:MAG: MaoC/PaaZ C-terminal domain-containing protein [Solirubrobacterales bacterium]
MALTEGEKINEVRVTPDKYLPHRYAGASGDFNPIHIDKEFATAVGLPNTILHGLWSMAQVQRAAMQAAGNDPTKIKTLSAQFRGMGQPETEVVVTGEVASVGPAGEVILNLEAAQGDSRIIRNSSATIETE